MRARIFFTKSGPMRFTGHLDLQRALERACRRASLPLKYSQGFNPRPKINLACALPLGFTSQAEIADIWLSDNVTAESIQKALAESFPPGLGIEKVEIVENGLPSLQSQMHAATYNITLLNPISNLSERIADIVESHSLPRVRRGKAYDLKPLIVDIKQLKPIIEGHQQIEITLLAEEGATGRPEEVMLAMGIPPEETLIHRKKILFKHLESEEIVK